MLRRVNAQHISKLHDDDTIWGRKAARDVRSPPSGRVRTRAVQDGVHRGALHSRSSYRHEEALGRVPDDRI